MAFMLDNKGRPIPYNSTGRCEGCGFREHGHFLNMAVAAGKMLSGRPPALVCDRCWDLLLELLRRELAGKPVEAAGS